MVCFLKASLHMTSYYGKKRGTHVFVSTTCRGGRVEEIFYGAPPPFQVLGYCVSVQKNRSNDKFSNCCSMFMSNYDYTVKLMRRFSKEECAYVTESDNYSDL